MARSDAERQAALLAHKTAWVERVRSGARGIYIEVWDGEFRAEAVVESYAMDALEPAAWPELARARTADAVAVIEQAKRYGAKS